MTATDTHRAIDAVWRIESPRLIAGLARIVRDVGLAEDLAQDALVAALEQWPESGVPGNPGAWLMATAKHRAIDHFRRNKLLERKHEELGHELEAQQETAAADLDAALDDDVGDDLLRLVFTACHPVLSTEARVALTLRLLGGLTTDEIARAFLVPEPTIAQRIVRAKRTLAEEQVPFEVPRGAELAAPPVVGARGDLPRLQRGLLGDRRRRLDAAGALRGRAAARAHPGRARAAGAGGPRPRRADGDPGVALEGARRARRASRSCCSIRTARAGISSSSAAASRRSSAPRQLGGARGPYALQAAIAACHARARAPEETDWARIAALYELLAALAPSPVVELNRAVAVAMAFGPAGGPRARRRADRGAVAQGLPPPAERARRPARQARPLRRGPRGVRARGVAHAQRARARAAARSRRRVRTRVGRGVRRGRLRPQSIGDP